VAVGNNCLNLVVYISNAKVWTFIFRIGNLEVKLDVIYVKVMNVNECK